MPVRYLSDPELARLSGWPDEIADEDAVTFCTLSADELAWLAGFNRAENRLGVAGQLSALPWLGWVPDDLAGRPAAFSALVKRGAVGRPGAPFTSTPERHDHAIHF
jgi:hypothetical protein